MNFAIAFPFLLVPWVGYNIVRNQGRILMTLLKGLLLMTYAGALILSGILGLKQSIQMSNLDFKPLEAFGTSQAIIIATIVILFFQAFLWKRARPLTIGGNQGPRPRRC
eukprot:Polyplicarium_translucidae@DN1824_c0_g1_i1.p1